MTYLIISLILSITCLAGTFYLVMTKNPKKTEKELLRLAETRFTAVMGGMLIIMGFFLLVVKMIDPTRGGSDPTSYIFASLLALLCVASGCGIMLFTLLKQIIAHEEKLVIVSMFGKRTNLFWKDITEIKLKPLSSKVTFVSKNKNLLVGGEPKTYKKFIAIAKTKIPTRVSHDLLDKLSNRFL